MRSISRTIRVSPYAVGVIVMAIAVATSAVEITATAVPGEPFGVACVQLKFPDESHKFSFTQGDFHVTQKDGRALYVAYHDPITPWYGPAPEATGQGKFYFLFTGTGNFDLVVYTPDPTNVPIMPAGDQLNNWA
jgi:hypothetical protein